MSKATYNAAATTVTTVAAVLCGHLSSLMTGQDAKCYNNSFSLPKVLVAQSKNCAFYTFQKQTWYVSRGLLSMLRSQTLAVR